VATARKKNASDNLQDHLLKRRHEIALFENHFVKAEVAPALEVARRRVQPQIMDFYVGKSVDTTIAERLAIMNRQYPELVRPIRNAYAQIGDRLGKALPEMTVGEYEFLADEINALLPDGGITPLNPKLPVATAHDLLNNPIGREPWTSYLDKNYGRLATGVKTQLSQSILMGEGMSKAAGRLRQQFGMARKEAERLARTEIMHASNAGLRQLYRDNADIVKRMQWCSTLDDRTCGQCAFLDGRRWKEDNAPQPPVHANCRCLLTPVLASWREMGLPIDTDPAYRASLNGYVPAQMNYREWFGEQGEAFQKAWLGPTRYELYKSGALKLDKMITGKGFKTLDQLKKSGVKIPRTAKIAKAVKTERVATVVVPKIERMPFVSPDHTRHVQKLVDGLGEKTLQRLADNGVQIVAPRRSINALTDLQKKYSNIDLKKHSPEGLYRFDNKTVIIPEYKTVQGKLVAISRDRITGTVYHEVGHAVDNSIKTGKAWSGTSGFKGAWKKDISTLDKATSSQLSYLTQSTKKSAGHQEAFAEVFSAIHGHTVMPDKTAAQIVGLFPNCARFIKELL